MHCRLLKCLGVAVPLLVNSQQSLETSLLFVISIALLYFSNLPCGEYVNTKKYNNLNCLEKKGFCATKLSLWHVHYVCYKKVEHFSIYHRTPNVCRIVNIHYMLFKTYILDSLPTQ